MLDQILSDAAREASPVKYPSGYYSPDGDCIFIYNEGGEYIRQRVDGLLTVFRAPDDGRIIGLQIKGVKKLPPSEAIEVEVASRGTDAKGRRVDTVRLLLHSYKQESAEETDEAERTQAYAEAFGLLGCRQLEVELQGAK